MAEPGICPGALIADTHAPGHPWLACLHTLTGVQGSLDSILWSEEEPLPTLSREEGPTLPPGMQCPELELQGPSRPRGEAASSSWSRAQLRTSWGRIWRLSHPSQGQQGLGRSES